MFQNWNILSILSVLKKFHILDFKTSDQSTVLALFREENEAQRDGNSSCMFSQLLVLLVLLHTPSSVIPPCPAVACERPYSTFFC
jgi:hypothetical protein